MNALFKRVCIVAITFASQLSWVPLTAQAVAPPPNNIISVDSDGQYGDRNSSPINLSADGRYVLFSSDSTNLSGFSTRKSRVYLRDRQQQTTTLVSNSPTNPDMALVAGVRLTANGQFMFFATTPRMVNPADTDTKTYLYVKDLTTGSITNIEKTYFGSASSSPTSIDWGSYFSPSDDGSKILLRHVTSFSGGVSDNLYLLNRTAPSGTNPLTQIATNMAPIGLSGDASTAYFATPLYPGYNFGPNYSVYKYDTTAHSTTTIFNNIPGGTANRFKVSQTGKYLGFWGDASVWQGLSVCDPATTVGGGCSRIYRLNTEDSTLTRIDARADGSEPSGYHVAERYGMSSDGNVFTWRTDSIMQSNNTYLAYPGIYSKHIDTGEIHLVNVDPNGRPGDRGVSNDAMTLSADGSETALAISGHLFGAPENCDEMLGEFFTGKKIGCVNVYALPTRPTDIADMTEPQNISVQFVYQSALLNQSMPLIIRAEDPGVGLAGAEYYVGDTDPGIGQASRINYGSGLYVFPGSTIAEGYGYYANIYDQTDTAGTKTMHYRVYDNAGNWSSTFSAQFNVVDPSSDVTAPIVGSPSWTINPKQLEDTSVLSVPASDDLSGVAGGEYYLGNDDPGQFNATQMSWDGTKLSAEFDENLDPGVYVVHIRARDQVGHWSNLVSTTLVNGVIPSPTDLSASSPTNNAPVLSWTAANGATSYQIWREDTLTGTSIPVGTTAATNFTDVYLPGIYNYTVVAIDAAGTVSQPSNSVEVAVTNLSQSTTNARNVVAQGQSQVVPVLGTDQLPGLAAGNTVPAPFDFSIGYQPNGSLSVARPLTFTFNAGGQMFHAASSSVDWLVVSGANNSVGTFQGHATLTQNGATTENVPYKVTIVDGAAAGPGAVSNLKLTFYANEARTAALYQVSRPLSKGKVKIN